MNARRATPFLAVAMVLAAAMFGVPALYVPGIGLLLAFDAARIWVRLVARRVRLEHQPGPRTVVEGEPYPLRLLVRGGGLPIPSASVTHPLAQGPAQAAPRAGSPTVTEIALPRRGWHQIEPATLVISAPLGLATARVRGVDAPRVLVLPRIEDVVADVKAINGAEDAIPGGAHAAHGAGLGKRALDFEVDGLRAYRPGTPASRIHWPILARTGELVERRLVGGANSSPIVVLDSERPVDPGALDRAVRAAASLCFHLAPAAGCVLFLAGERVPLRIDRELRAWPEAHARLAMVEPSGSVVKPGLALRAATVIWVSATGTIPRLPRRLGGTATYLVAAAPVDGLDDLAFTVAECGVHRLGTEPARTKARAA
jgi:uncharacterized protein (DUF58 family)